LRWLAAELLGEVITISSSANGTPKILLLCSLHQHEVGEELVNGSPQIDYPAPIIALSILQTPAMVSAIDDDAVDQFTRLPDELIEAIVAYLPPADTVAFGATCKRCNKITYVPLVWRRHCLQGWKHWEEQHELRDKLERPPAQTKWRLLFQQRQKTDEEALETFKALLPTRQRRIERMEAVAKMGYDVKDLMLKQRDETPEDAEDVLARRYHANAILGQIHRKTALDRWLRLQRHQMVKLEEVLGAYDLFVLAGRKGDLNDIDRELDRLAKAIKDRDPDFDYLSIRKKAVQIARFLRSENLVGNPMEEDYHALRNNFISIALFDEPHTSLPLQSAAIYCAVARRLGVNAKPTNYPNHVHAVIEAPADVDLDGKARTSRDNESDDPAHFMYMDPWRSSTEVPRTQLTIRLSQMGAPVGHHDHHLGATSTMEVVLRTSRNIMNSVQEARGRQRGTTRRPLYPDMESAWYAMLWSMLVLGESNQASTLHRRRQCLPYLLEHFQSHFPEDLGLVESIIIPMFENEREYNVLLRLVNQARVSDSNKPAPSHRPKKILSRVMPSDVLGVAFKIGTHFEHRRYGYNGIIIGWDTKCGAEDHWIREMRVDELPRGREQPFYNVVSVPHPPHDQTYYYVLVVPEARGGANTMYSADDKSIRYVAEENIKAVTERPSESLMALAGRYFKRWDAGEGKFVSNMREEYPDD
jgi:F-box protein 21